MSKKHLVEFNKQAIIAVEDEDGNVWVPVKRLCENLGVSLWRQHQKIISDESFNHTLMLIVAEDGKNREMLCLSKEDVHGWLFTINPSRVKPELRAGIIKYRRECLKTLNEYFETGVALNHRFSREELLQETIKKLELKALTHDNIFNAKLDMIGIKAATISDAARAAGAPRTVDGINKLLELGILYRDESQKASIKGLGKLMPNPAYVQSGDFTIIGSSVIKSKKTTYLTLVTERGLDTLRTLFRTSGILNNRTVEYWQTVADNNV